MQKIRLARLAGYITLTLAALGTISAAYGAQIALGVLVCASMFASSFIQSATTLGAAPPMNKFYGNNTGNVDLWYGTPTISLDIPTVAVPTATSPVTLSEIVLPPGLGRFICLGYTLTAITAAGTLAACSIGIYTATAGGGVAVVASTVLTGVTAINIGCTTNAALTTQVVNAATVTSLFVHATVDSANAGTVAGRILIQPVR